ncbi:hypothetical protein PNH50_18470 [Leisingera aquaemixtae]|uniref:hypothetical protein n=1 Tax=Leisingera aquaemixtae TaxID=1396826 RepID=UPI0039845BAA
MEAPARPEHSERHFTERGMRACGDTSALAPASGGDNIGIKLPKMFPHHARHEFIIFEMQGFPRMPHDPVPLLVRGKPETGIWPQESPSGTI